MSNRAGHEGLGTEHLPPMTLMRPPLGVGAKLHKLFVHLRRKPLTAIGLTIVLILLLTAVLAPLIAPYDPLKIDLPHRSEPPSLQHPFGTDIQGRDVLSRVIHGSRISLRIGFIVILLAATTGSLVGIISGYFGGRLDEIAMRVTDIFFAFPSLVLAMSITATLGPGLTSAMIAMCLVWWPTYARLARGQALSIRERTYIEAARSVGAGNSRIMFRHVLPNCWDPLIVQASLDFGNAVLMAATLSFIGLGAQPPLPEWGAMISRGRTYLRESWWAPTFPGLAILFTVLGLNLLGDEIRDLLDPRFRGV